MYVEYYELLILANIYGNVMVIYSCDKCIYIRGS